jgi:hypothetical protein
MGLHGATTGAHAWLMKAATNPDIRLRRIVPEDAAALCRFDAALSPDSRRLRFLSLGTRFGDKDARYFRGSDHEHRKGFVAELATPEADGTRIVGHLCPLDRTLADGGAGWRTRDLDLDPARDHAPRR